MTPVIRVQTYSKVLARFRNHPEAKSADSKGNPCDWDTIGLLGRRHVQVGLIRQIGKETNLLEQQTEGVLTADPQAVYDLGDEAEFIQRRLQGVSIAEVSRLSGIDARALLKYRAGQHEPRRKVADAILEALVGISGGSGGR